MKVNIEGCPLSSAKVQSFELGESVFAPPRGKSKRDVDFRASLRLSGQIVFFDAFLTGYRLPPLTKSPCPDPPFEEVSFAFGSYSAA